MAPVPAIVEQKLGKDYGVFTYLEDEDVAEYCQFWAERPCPPGEATDD